ncbi:MAG: tyrosine-type recombinase/integrase [Acidimicrobiia bacterium]
MAHIKDRGKDLERRWQARYRDPDGQEKSRTFTRKVDAQRWLDQVTTDLVTGRYVDPNAGRQTLAGFAGRWLDAQTFDPSTRETMESRIRVHIEPTLGELELRNLRPSTIQAWVRGRQTEVAPSYVRLLLTNLSTILSAAVEDGLIGVNPATVSSVKPPRVDRRRVVPWTVESVQSVVEAHPSEFRAVPVLGAGCGLRQGEIFGLPIENVDFLRRVVHVRQQLRRIGRETVLALPKGGREREVPLPDVVSVALAEHLRIHGTTETMLPWRDPEGEPRTASLLFTNRDHGPLTRAYYTHNAWKPALEAADVKRSRENGMHALRHHYASVLLERGVSIRAVAEYLGHHDPGFTLRTYAHLMPESEDRARAAIDSAHAPAESSRNANGLPK